MLRIRKYDKKNKPGQEIENKIIDFLFSHLESYGDPKNDIKNSIDYALQETTSFGGFLIVAYKEDQIIGVTVVNRTGMKGYIPENIVVYIAVHRNHRGNGYGKRLMKESIANATGDLALHVEPNNPAKYLYEKLGFKNKYFEMRLKK